MARRSDFCVDRYEAHLGVRVGDAIVPHPPYERPTPGDDIVALSAPGVVPQGYVNRNEAERACEHAGKRLCSLSEWYAACRGAQGSRFPYGARYKHRRCNSGKPHLLSRLFGSNPRAWNYELHFNSDKLNREPGFLARTGEYEGCVDEQGIHDMVGNLHEWVKDPVSLDLPRRIPLVRKLVATLPRQRGKGIFAGGFYGTLFEHGQGCAFVTLAHEPGYHDYSTGFRCCRDARGGG